MHNIVAAVLIAASASSVFGAADFIDGNWYSNAVDNLVFTNWGAPGTYQEVTNMSDNQCAKTLVSYGGGMAPLDKEVSLHFRGPMHLTSFAFYAPELSSSKRTLKSSPDQERQSHAHSHPDRGVGDWVTATINGIVDSWINEYAGPSTMASVTRSSTNLMTGSLTTAPQAFYTVTSPSSTSSAAISTSMAEAGIWRRQAYYNATTSIADGLVFLNNHGGEGSGVFENYPWGMSLSYASPDGQSGAVSPQILSDTLLEDQVEIIIYTDKECEGNSCGVYRPGTVAYHGFDGNYKIFLIEFDMPHMITTGNYTDMPAVWILNAAIPRTQQYGSCSCWPQCGEWDIFEILNSGGDMAKSTIHADISGGPNQYFERPVNKTMKAAVVFDGSTSSGSIFVLPDDAKFETALTDDEVAAFGDPYSISNDISAKFVLGS